jgi:regulator of sirC expression with transglutaminase-like and TPR domain
LVDTTQDLANAYLQVGNRLSALSLLESFVNRYPTSAETLRPQIDDIRDSKKSAKVSAFAR